MKTYNPWDIYEWWEKLTPLPEDKTTEELGLKEWDLFVVVIDDDSLYKPWETIKLTDDDYTSCPRFSNWIIWHHMHIQELAKLPQEEESKQEVTYETQYVWTDRTIVTKDSINGRKLEDIRKDYNECRRLLTEHKKFTF